MGWAKSGTRRAQAVVLGLLGLAPVVICFLVRNPLAAIPWWAAVVVLAAARWWLSTQIDRVPDASAELLDERQVHIRNRAAWWGQAATVGFLAGIAVLVQIVSRAPYDQHLWLQRTGGIALSAAFLAAVIPTVLVGWMMAPDELFDDEDDDEDIRGEVVHDEEM